MCLLAWVMYGFKMYVMCTLLGLRDAYYAYYYSYTLLMSYLHLVSYKLPASCPVAVKLDSMLCGVFTQRYKSNYTQLEFNYKRTWRE